MKNIYHSVQKCATFVEIDVAGWVLSSDVKKDAILGLSLLSKLTIGEWLLFND